VSDPQAAPAEWRRFDFPDANLCDLVQRFVTPPNGLAVDLGCGSGRHARYLLDHGFDAIGVESDAGMLAACDAAGVPTVRASVTDFAPPEPPRLVLAWGLMMLSDIPQVIGHVARLGGERVIADWRTPDNTFLLDAEDDADAPPLAGSRAVVVRRPGHHLDGLRYRVFEPGACHIPGYDRVHLQTVTIAEHATPLAGPDGVEVHAWHQTVHRRR